MRAAISADAYAVSPGEWILIRPDGFVGVTRSDNVSALERYLAEVGIMAGRRAAV
jgi:hypothetical protein